MSSSFADLQAFLEEVAATKEAANKTEPGTHSGPSSHPTADVDSGTQDSSEGARAREHEEDAKDYPGVPLPDHAPSDAPSMQETSTSKEVTPSFVGEDPSVEDDYTTNQEDPGTSHPAEYGDTTKEKVSSLNDDELLEKISAVSNEILADIAMTARTSWQGKTATRSASVAPRSHAKTAAEEKLAAAKQALIAGYEAANQILDEAEKTAAQAEIGEGDDLTQEVLMEAMLQGDIMAEKTAAAIAAYTQELAKSAMDEEEMGADVDSSDDGSMDPAGEEGDIASSPEEAAAMVAEEGPSIDIDALMGNIADQEEEPDEEEALQELASAMVEMGVSPEELVESAADAGKEAANRTTMRKVANAVKRYRRSGKFSFGPPKTKRAAHLRSQMRKYLATALS